MSAMEPEMEKAHRILRDIFGHSNFRLSQEAVIRRLLVQNENALVLFPTGGGKSLTYQIPALCLDGLTLVISPLIALMKDQVDALVKLGVKAANLDSTLEAARASSIKEDVLHGRLKILYVAPERLNNEGFMAMMSRVKISLLAVDESHCISQWGSSFRPEYLKISRFAEELDVGRVLCLTATATASVSNDICKSFYISPEHGIFRTPVYRPNLQLEVEVADNLSQKLEHMVPLLKSRTGPAIVYVTLQKHAEEVAARLERRGFEAMVYHAGLPNDQRQKVQDQFMQSEKGIVCATIAFGMGIDKSNIRQVVHLYMPKTLENYSQEIGRAGRDGLPSTCLMFLSAPDIPVLTGFCRGDTCLKRDLRLWLQEVASKIPEDDKTISFNHYQQARDYDIKSNTLALLYAQLELEPTFQFIRATTPFYALYDISARVPTLWGQVLADQTKEAVVIRTYWSPKSTRYHIDVVNAAKLSGVPRRDLARKIHIWELDGLINAKASQVRARYNVLKDLPTEQKDLDVIADSMYQQMLQKEEENVQKLQQVIDFATNDDCLASRLSAYFGEENVVQGDLCGVCSFCKRGHGIDFKPIAATMPDPAQVAAILAACPERDDPRLLARMAFGITSPRLTAGRWSTSHPLFGSMGTTDFNSLIAAFDAECKKVGYQNQTVEISVPKRKSSMTPWGRRETQSRKRGR